MNMEQFHSKVGHACDLDGVVCNIFRGMCGVQEGTSPTMCLAYQNAVNAFGQIWKQPPVGAWIVN